MRSTFVKSEDGVGVINTDQNGYRQAVARKKQDKYIKGLEARIAKLESSMKLLQNTIKEIAK